MFEILYYAPIFMDFSQCMWLLENHQISEPSGIVENFKHSSAVPNVKYNCAILFWKELYCLFINSSQFFLIDHHCKTFHRIY